ncbi:hypothetical protein DSO57_1026857 [Entomophthora muscae]|uniref:Uncharacterized protein n=1 Tax=Entomophthora muscae TaxID=34485 RepID=A0ACC2SEW4_9FUNG|nr:hypothetical protein DSO57_1026857 [Entomophthora muscae]
MSSSNTNQVNELFPGLDIFMQGYPGSFNSEASVYGHSQPAGVTVGSIMPGIVRPINQKWVTAAPVCQLKPAPPFKLTLINWRNMRVTQYELVNQHGCQKLVTQGFFATWTRYLLDNLEGIGGQDSGGIA